MRVLSIVMVVLGVALPAHAVAKPKARIAVAPIRGDTGNKVGNAVAQALAGKDFVVIGPKEVSREAQADDLSPKDVRTLIKKLEVVAVVDGVITKGGKKRTLHLEIHRRGKAAAGFTMEVTSTSSVAFRRAVHDQIANKLEADGEQEADEDDEDARRVAAQKAEDDERKRKLADDETSRARDDDRKHKLADDEVARKRASSAERGRRPGRRLAEDDEPAVRKRRPGHGAALTLARINAGASLAQRRLTYNTRSGFTQIPPRVITTAGAGRVDGEIYPFALASADSRFAGLGLAASYDKTFGLAIKVPNQTVSAPISQSHYAVGARYRFGLGEASSITLGLDYARRRYVADRSGLMAVVLDAPDVDYSAIAPGVAARVPVAAKIAAFAAVDAMLMLETGPIQTTASYGPANVYGIEALGGVDIQIASQLDLRVAVEYTQINFSFSAKGAMATSRDNDPATQDVTGAIDRSIGVAATLGLAY